MIIPYNNPSAASVLNSLGGSIGGRNRIVNGDMRIDQANAGAAVSVNAAATFRSVDKFSGFGAGSAGAYSLQQLSATPPNGFTNYLRSTVTTADAAPAAGSGYSLSTVIEGTYCQDLQFGIAANTQSVALGFWVRSSLTGSFSGSLRNSGGTRSYAFSFTIAAANTWQFISVVIPSDTTGTWNTNTSGGITVSFDLGAGTSVRTAANTWTAGSFVGVTGAASLLATLSATFDITGVQLEPGTVATPFEQRPFGDMLRLCQREYEKSFLIATAPVTNVGSNTGEQQFAAGIAAAASDIAYTEFQVNKRAAPTITYFNPNAANAQVRDQTATADATATAATNNTERGFLTTCTGNIATVVGNKLAFHYTADARL